MQRGEGRKRDIESRKKVIYAATFSSRPCEMIKAVQEKNAPNRQTYNIQALHREKR